MSRDLFTRHSLLSQPDELSRDVEHANKTLSPIFDLEKEQNRLKEAQLIGEIGVQVGDIARTQGQIVATKAANEKMKDVSPEQMKTAEAEWRKANPGKEPTEKNISDQAWQNFYNKAFNESDFGTGGKVQRAIQAATAAVQGLAGGDLAKAVAGGSAPYIANVIGSSGLDDAGKVLAHAAVNAALAAGLAGGLTGDSTADTVAAAQAGKTTVENNYLSSKEARQLDKEMQACKASGGDCGKMAEKYIDISNKNSQELVEACTGGGVACVSWQELIQGATNVANDAHPSQIRLDEKLKDPSAATLVNYLNGTDLQFLQDNITTGDRIMDVVMDPISWPVAIMGGKAIISNVVNNTNEQLIAVGVAGTASAGIQYGTTGEVKLSDVIGSVIVGGVTAGKGYNPTMAWNAAGGYYQAEISGDDPFMAALMSKAGASAGYITGNIIKVPMDKVFNPVSKQYEWVPTGVWTITKPASQHPLPSIVGNMGDSAASELIPKYLEKKPEANK